MVDNNEEIVHVKNTGRCREILQEGTVVILEEAKNTERKTKYSLIACYKGNVLINIIKWVCHLQPIDANNSIKFVAEVQKVQIVRSVDQHR